MRGAGVAFEEVADASGMPVVSGHVPIVRYPIVLCRDMPPCTHMRSGRHSDGRGDARTHVPEWKWRLRYRHRPRFPVTCVALGAERASCSPSQSESSLAVLEWALVVITIIATIVYPAPWTAMTADPLVYIGVGVVCDWLGRLAGRTLEEIAVRARLSIRDRMQWIVVVISWLGLFLVVAQTNGDLWGDTRFAIAWWQSYAQVPRY